MNVVSARTSYVEWRGEQARLTAPHALRGISAADRAAANGPWTFLVIDPPEAGGFAGDGTLTSFEPEIDDANARLTLWRTERPFGDRLEPHVFRWTLDGDVLRLDRDGAEYAFRRWETRVLLLPQQQFRWMQERRARGQ